MPETSTQPGTPQPAAYAPTDRTVPTRSAKRAAYDHESVHSILDEGYVCHLGFVRDGAPVVLPPSTDASASASTCTVRQARAPCG